MTDKLNGPGGALDEAEQADLLAAVESVLLDRTYRAAADSPSALAERLPMSAPLTVFTNTLDVALAVLGRSPSALHVIGGRVRATTLATVDQWAERAFAEIRVDVAFLGTNAFSVEHGLSTPDGAEAAVKGAMVECAALRVLLADHSKLGREAVFRYAELSAIDVLVTDTELGVRDARAIERAGVEVVRA